MSTVAERWDQAIATLEPSAADRARAVFLHKTIRCALDYQKQMTEKTFLTGSYARHTAINPFHDVDIFMVVVPDGDRTTATAVLERVRTMLETALANERSVGVVAVRAQRRSVGVSFPHVKITVDVVPALAQPNGGYLIADREMDAWIHTDPVAAFKAVTAANKASGGHLVPLIKVAKAWNLKMAKTLNKLDKRGDLIKPFKSFHLEVLCYGFKVPTPFNLRNGVWGLFAFLADNCNQRLCSPGGGAHLDSYLHKTGADKHPHDLNTLLRAAATLACEALLNEGRNPELAHTKWGQLIGAVY